MPASETGGLAPVTLPTPLKRLFDGEARLVIASFCENERPLRSLASWLDWHFDGAVSQALREGRIKGSAGECVLFPVARGGRFFSFLLVGAGEIPIHGRRPALPPESVQALCSNLQKLGLAPVALSRSDLGETPAPVLERLEKSLKKSAGQSPQASPSSVSVEKNAPKNPQESPESPPGNSLEKSLEKSFEGGVLWIDP